MSHNGTVMDEGDRSDLSRGLDLMQLSPSDVKTAIKMIDATGQLIGRTAMRWHIIRSGDEMAIWWDDGGDRRNLMYVWRSHVLWSYSCPQPESVTINHARSRGDGTTDPCHYFPGHVPTASASRNKTVQVRRVTCVCGMQAPLSHDGKCESCDAHLDLHRAVL